jgi:hypothetical protein
VCLLRGTDWVFKYTCCPHTVFMCFVWISEQTAIISLYNINWLVFITETECVYCAVRTESLNVIQANRLFKGLSNKCYRQSHRKQDSPKEICSACACARITTLTAIQKYERAREVKQAAVVVQACQTARRYKRNTIRRNRVLSTYFGTLSKTFHWY